MNAKMGFQKLQTINDNIVSAAARGVETATLEMEKKQIQKMVISKFKNFKKGEYLGTWTSHCIVLYCFVLFCIALYC